MSGLFCLVSVSFYDSLLGATLGLLVIVLLAAAVYRLLPNKRKDVLLATVYFCIFAFPVLSVKIMETFACHTVEGERFLRADYALSCDDRKWKQWAIYAGMWVAFFVVGFPLFLLTKLLRMRADLRNGKAAEPDQFMLGFLLHDYKSFGEGASVACLWEGKGTRICHEIDVPNITLSFSRRDRAQAAAEYYWRILVGQEPPRHRHCPAAVCRLVGAARVCSAIQVPQIQFAAIILLVGVDW
jgi:hypothetical protein